MSLDQKTISSSDLLQWTIHSAPNHRNPIRNAYRAIFTCDESNSCLLSDWFKTLTQLFQPIRSKNKTNHVSLAHTPRASRQLHVFAASFDWITGSSVRPLWLASVNLLWFWFYDNQWKTPLIFFEVNKLPRQFIQPLQEFITTEVCIYGNGAANMPFAWNLFLDCFFFFFFLHALWRLQLSGQARGNARKNFSCD